MNNNNDEDEKTQPASLSSLIREDGQNTDEGNTETGPGK